MNRVLANDWAVERSRLNHDWLKNEFIRHLLGFLNRLDAKDPDVTRLQSLITDDLPELIAMRPQLEQLIDRFEDAMSPRVLLGEPPLSDIPLDARTWLGQVVHALWKNRYPIDTWTQQCRDALQDTGLAYEDLQHELDNPQQDDVVARWRSLKPAFLRLQAAASLLSQNISMLPDRVLVT